MAERIEMAKVSSRGQVCIPTEIREDLGLKEGTKILFILKDGQVIIKKVVPETWEEITRPLKEEAKKKGLRESDAQGIIERFRKQKR